jgi:hypothetical protein
MFAPLYQTTQRHIQEDRNPNTAVRAIEVVSFHIFPESLFTDNPIQGVPRGKNIGHSKQKMYMHVCPIPNGFRGRAISLYGSKIVDKKEILRTVSNTGIYCSSDKVCTVYLV